MPVIAELATLVGFQVQGSADLERADQRLKNLEGSLKTAARTAGIFGAAFAGATLVIGRSVLTVEQARNRLAATLGESASVEQLSMLETQARELGRTTSRTITDATQAQVELARAGFSVQEVFAAVPHVLNLSIAGELEMAEAAQLVANQLRAFKLPATEAARVTDVLAHAANNANTTVADMGPALRNVAPAASALGVSIETTVAAVASLRNVGLIPQQAGVAVRNLFLRLIDDNDMTLQSLEVLGTTRDAILDELLAGDFAGALDALLAGAEGVSERDRITAMTNIFGARSIVAALELTGVTDQVREFTGELETADGAAGRMRDTIEGGLPGGVYRLQSAVDGLMEAIGQSGLTRILQFAAESLTALTNAFHLLPGPLQSLTAIALPALAISLLGVAAGAQGLLWVLGGLRLAVSVLTSAMARNIVVSVALRANMIRMSIATAAQTLATTLNTAALNGNVIAMGIMAVVRGLATAGTWAWVTAQTALNVALLANPIGLVVLAIVALVAALGGAVYLFVRFRRQIFDWLRDNWDLLTPILLGPFGLLLIFLRRWGDDAIDVAKRVLDWIGDNWGRLTDILTMPFRALVRSVQSSVSFVRAMVRDAFNWVVGMVRRIAEPIVQLMAKLHVPGAGSLLDALSNLERVAADLSGGISIPQPPPASAPSSVVSTSTTTIGGDTNVNIEQVAVDARGSDSEEIGRNLGQSIEEGYAEGAEAARTGVDA